ncbi:MAG: DUF1549 and DUF1553 domain-containing protein [Leptothrix sp. (in: b-proteobacteria)]
MKTKLSLAIWLAFAATTVVAADTKPLAVEAKPAAPAKTWSPYQPVSAVAVPDVKQKAWVRSPIDAFMLAKLENAGLKPSPEADRATYIRRATLDAWGLLPTPEEVAAFVSDKSPDAYDKLVDRLLASPHFGERQARRWLDLARYADSSGFQNDTTRANMYRYRDYVIDAFNKDKPYSRFVQEQIAGDELWPDSEEAKIATGFLAGYPDNLNSRDLVQRKYQIETDNTDLIGETLLGATVGCARCHNHKADKLSQKEYFQLQAYLANLSFDVRTQTKERPVRDPEFQKTQDAYNATTKELRDKIKAITDKYEAAGVKYQKERYLTDSRDALFKPEKEWNGLERWVNWRHKNQINSQNEGQQHLRLVATDESHVEHTPEAIADYKEYQRLSAELAKFDNLKPKRRDDGVVFNYTTATELTATDVPKTFVRFTGQHERPTDEVQPAIPSLWLGNGAQPTIKATDKSSGRRTALASWLTADSNPLTARVYVNRVWAQLFDKGIVSTVQDFGRAGAKPTNPELLDFLATSFVKDGWSVKKLQREILLSSTYRQSSAERADVVKADPDNKLLAVFPRKRLEAEELRDSLLYASGQLVDKVGGPAVFPPVPKNLNAGNLWQEPRNDEETRRRTIYTFVRRSVPYPLTVNFDPANPVQPHQKRDVTTTPLQALTLFNADITFGWSQALAGRVINEANGKDEGAKLDRLYEVLFARKPTKDERTALVSFLDQQEKLIASKSAASGTFQVAIPTGVKPEKALANPLRAAAFVDLVHTVANANDFAYRF